MTELEKLYTELVKYFYEHSSSPEELELEAERYDILKNEMGIKFNDIFYTQFGKTKIIRK